MTFDEVLTRFPGATRNGDGYMARCPCHDDSKASLRISRSTDRTLLFCHAGCKTTSVAYASGLTMSDLFFDGGKSRHRRNGHSKPNIVTTYDYRDEQGELLFQSCRMKPKSFRQRRPNGQGGWTWGVRGVRVVPYRLPELLGSDGVVFIVEGEKDADRLANIGMTATCNAGGSGKWRDEFSQHLAGRDAVILPDNDAAGRKHATKVARSLAGRSSSIRVLDLPGLADKGDVSDWLDAGGTTDGLQKLVAECPEWIDNGEHDDKSPPPFVTNAEPGEGEDEWTPLSMKHILENVSRLTGDWPRRVGDALFIHDHDVISWLVTTDALLGWIGSTTGEPPRFRKSSACHTAAQVFHELRRLAQQYAAVEMIPHEPPIERHYYACEWPEPSDGEALRGLVRRYSPATDIDGDLITTMFVTAFWGGASGARPAFLIDSDAGRGAGKSTLAGHVAYLVGGSIELSANEDAGVMKQRLLSAEGMTKRVALLDNVKSFRFSWAELESLITTPVISGKRLYVGEGQRPNNIMWVITLNGASLAKDLAQRCVIVKLDKPNRSATWAEETRAYIDHRRQDIIADCLTLLRGPRNSLEQYSRWAAWEHDVLSHMPEPSDAQLVIRERQAVADVEDMEAGIIVDYFSQKIAQAGYSPDRDAVFVPSVMATTWFNEATNERASTTAVSRRLKQLINEGTITLLDINRSNAKGRGFLWKGPSWNSEPVMTDIESRLDRLN